MATVELSGTINLTKPKPRKPTVLVSVPTGDGWIHKHVVFALVKLYQDPRYTITVILPTHKPIEENMARVQRDFLAGDYDYLLSIDSDNPPQRNPLDLIELDKDIIGCPTPVWANMKKGDQPFYYNALYAVEGGYKPVQPQENMLLQVDAIGGGCFVLARRVLEAMQFDMPFQRTWNADGTMNVGWDYSFCTKAKQRGFEIWAHFGYTCLHFNEVELTETITALLEMQHAPSTANQQ